MNHDQQEPVNRDRREGFDKDQREVAGQPIHQGSKRLASTKPPKVQAKPEAGR